jgi:diguanylate cyclase (GGDEF)-like protein
VLNAVRKSRPSASTWWLTRQPVAIRRYFAATVSLSVALTVVVFSIAPMTHHYDVLGVAVFCVLAVGVSLATRPVLAAFPGAPAIQDLTGAWMLAALLIWGPAEAVTLALVICGVWTQYFDRRWAGSQRRTAQQVLNVAAAILGLDVAYLVMHWLGPQPHWLTPVAGMAAYVVVNFVVVLGILGLSGDANPLHVIDTWSSRVMLLTEAPLGLGMAAAWHTDPVAGALLSGSLIAAAAGLHAAHLLEEASTDRRTGLLRPDAWTGTVVRLLSRQQVAVILADVDHFKQVNDQHGHLVGDEVLSAIGLLITESLRPGDVAGRWGGEEFVVALPGCGSAAALEIAERLADTVRRATGVLSDSGIRCTISVGVALARVATPEEAGLAVRRALRDADMAMYAAKRAGRDRVVAADDLTSLQLELDPFAGATEPHVDLAADQPARADGARS